MTSPNSSIQDRTIYEDVEIFVNNLYNSGKMEQRDYETYRELYHLMVPFLRTPELLVYIRKSVPTLVRRIKQRGRPYEQNIPVEYLANLNTLYDQWIERYSQGKAIIVESDELDFIHSDDDFAYIRNLIVRNLAQPDLFIKSSDEIISTVEKRKHIAHNLRGA